MERHDVNAVRTLDGCASPPERSHGALYSLLRYSFPVTLSCRRNFGKWCGLSVRGWTAKICRPLLKGANCGGTDMSPDPQDWAKPCCKVPWQEEEEMGRQHQRMEWPGVRQLREGGRGEEGMEGSGCEVFCDAPATPIWLRDKKEMDYE